MRSVGRTRGELWDGAGGCPQSGRQKGAGVPAPGRAPQPDVSPGAGCSTAVPVLSSAAGTGEQLLLFFLLFDHEKKNL